MTGHKNAERGKYVGFTLNQVFGDGIEEEFGGVRMLFFMFQ